MFALTKNHLKKKNVIAEKDGYQLLEKHAIVYLHNWAVKNGTIEVDTQIKILMQSLKSDFELAPEQTIWELENNARNKFKDVDSLLKSLH